MKKIKLASIIFVIAVLFSACSKAEIDVRDAFVGTYSETITGSMNFTALGQQITMPLNSEENFTIEKATANNEVYRISDGESITGIINGNKITFSAISVSSDEDDLELTLNIEMSGSLNDNILICTGTITGTGKIIVASETFPITGSITSTAVKQ